MQTEAGSLSRVAPVRRLPCDNEESPSLIQSLKKRQKKTPKKTHTLSNLSLSLNKTISSCSSSSSPSDERDFKREKDDDVLMMR